jgi:hypothetical protein
MNPVLLPLFAFIVGVFAAIILARFIWSDYRQSRSDSGESIPTGERRSIPHASLPPRNLRRAGNRYALHEDEGGP